MPPITPNAKEIAVQFPGTTSTLKSVDPWYKFLKGKFFYYDLSDAEAWLTGIQEDPVDADFYYFGAGSDSQQGLDAVSLLAVLRKNQVANVFGVVQRFLGGEDGFFEVADRAIADLEAQGAISTPECATLLRQNNTSFIKSVETSSDSQ